MQDRKSCIDGKMPLVGSWAMALFSVKSVRVKPVGNPQLNDVPSSANPTIRTEVSLGCFGSMEPVSPPQSRWTCKPQALYAALRESRDFAAWTPALHWG